MKSRDLWELMTDIISRCLNENTTESPDQILEDTLENCTLIEEEEIVLVHDIVSGTLHFEKVCEGMLNGYCDCMRRNKSDKFSMYITAYLMIFRYTTLGGHRIRELIYRSTSTPRLVEYLEYILNPLNFMTYSNPYWSKYYDTNFILNTISRPMGEIAPHAQQDVIQWILGKTAAGVVRVDIDDEIQKSPESVKTLNSNKVNKKFQDNKNVEKNKINLPPAEVREMLYTIPIKRPPPIDYTKPPKEVIKHRKTPTEPIGFKFLKRPPRQVNKVEEQLVYQTNSYKHSPEELKPILSKPVHVRMTAGAIRREAHTYLRQIEEHKRSLDEVGATLHNSREFQNWQQKEKEREVQQHMKKLLDRKKHIKSTEENATQKRKELVEMNKAVSAEIKSKIASMIESNVAEKEVEVTKQRNYAFKMRQELYENKKKAIEKALQERLSAAADVKIQSEQLKEEVLEEEERQRTQRLLVIEEIRQLRERNRQRKAELMEKNISLQREISNDLSFDGFSLAALREELELVKKEKVKLEEERRARFHALREKERSKLNDLSAICANGRQNTRKAKEEERKRKEEEKAKIQALKEEEETKRALQVYETLKHKRIERREEQLALKGEDRRRKNELLLLAKDNYAMEENHWLQQELCVINRLTTNQNEGFRSGFK